MTRSGPQTMLATERFGKWNMQAFGFGVGRPSALLMVKLGATSRSYGYLPVPKRTQCEANATHNAVRPRAAFEVSGFPPDPLGLSRGSRPCCGRPKEKGW